MSATEQGRIFFSQDNVIFAAPIESLRRLEPGAPVVMVTSSGTIVGRGEIFRTRAEHVAVKILEGRGRVGDFARPASRTDLGIPIDPADRPSTGAADLPPPTPAAPGDAAPIAGVILVYRIANAPRLLADRFDADFARSLLKEAGTDSNLTICLKDRPGNLRLTSTRIRSAAKRAGASIVLVPEYRDDAAGDSLAVHLHDAATGRRIGTAATPIRLFEQLVFLPDGRRIGRLHLVGRYEGLEPAPNDLRLNEEGCPIMRVGREWFVIQDGETRFLRAFRPPRAREITTMLIGGTLHRITCEQTVDGLERIVISEGDRPIYATSPIGPGIAIAARGDRIAFLEGGVLKLLQIGAPDDTTSR